MKKSVYAAVTTAVLAALSQPALAQSYTVVELSKPDNLRETSAIDINNSGAIAVQGRFPLDIEIDLERITSGTRADAGISQDTDEETVTEITMAQYRRLIPLLEDVVNEQNRDQRVGMNYALTTNSDSLTINKFNDETSDNLFFSVNDNNEYVGAISGTYTEYAFENSFQNDDGDTVEVSGIYHDRDYIRRALWFREGQQQMIEPQEQTYLGGESGFYDINENGVAVGYQSTSVVTSAEDEIQSCIELSEEPEATFPTEACAWQEWHGRFSSRQNIGSFFSSSTVFLNGSIFNNSATIWQLDANGEVISEEVYGPIVERQEDDDGELSTYALAVNNNDIAVGQGWTYFRELVNSRIKMPAVFRDGESIAITESEDYRWGAANDINDNNLVIGYLKREFDGTVRNVGFTYDLEAEDPEVIELSGFFESSSTIPYSINNDGIIVGTAEIESNLNTARRRAGFMYDINNPEAGFINLNDLTGCDSDYFIVSADSINDQGQILATAVVESSYTNEDGDEVEEFVTRAVRLDPNSAEPESCEPEQGEVTEREGASLSISSLFGMLLIGGLITIRRKFLS